MELSNELSELFGLAPQDRASSWDVDDPRPERGTMVPLYTRLMRAFSGDPCAYATYVSNAAYAFTGLQNVPGARQAVIYVSGSDIVYRTDGSAPTLPVDQTIQEGSTVILTGKPTILGFIFGTATGTPAVLYVTYYD